MRLTPSKADKTTPVAFRTDDGVFVSHSGDVWLWMIMPKDALQWEDKERRRDVAGRWSQLLQSVGSTSRHGTISKRLGGSAAQRVRNFHILSVAWDYESPPSLNASPNLAEWQSRIFSQFRCEDTLTGFGVRLRKPPVLGRSVKSRLGDLVSGSIGADLDLTPYATDRNVISTMMTRAGGRPPTKAEADRLEFWWNGGRGSRGAIVIEPDGKSLSCDAYPEGLELSALIDYEQYQLSPDTGLWLNEAFNHVDGCVAVSIRGEVHHPKSVSNLFRRAQRKALTQIEENQATGDVERSEHYEAQEQSSNMEDYYKQSGEPLLRNCSFIFARQNSETVASFRDELQVRWGLETKILEFRQEHGLFETLPCSVSKLGREKPFAQDVSIGMIAHSGITSFSHIGDDEGAWIGVALSDMSPVFIDPAGAAKKNTPPAMLVIGEPGSGKTFLLQLLATQAAAAGYPVVFINPKPADSLDGFCAAAGGETIRLSALDETPGGLDPFRFARSPEEAARMLASHIVSVMNFEDRAANLLEHGLMQAALEGAKCGMDALKGEEVPPEARKDVEILCQTQSLFALAFGDREQPRLTLTNQEEGGGALTLVEFDRPLALPTTADPSQHTRDQRLAMAAIRLITNAAREAMYEKGGVLIVDEAHVLMASQEGQQVLERLGREGRSQGILPVIATQRIHDVISDATSMESYLGRVCVLKMTDPREVSAAMRVLRLEETDERVGILARSGPRRDPDGNTEGARGFLRDLEGNLSYLLVGQIPPDVEKLFSTNPLDRLERAEEELAQADALAAPVATSPQPTAPPLTPPATPPVTAPATPPAAAPEPTIAPPAAAPPPPPPVAPAPQPPPAAPTPQQTQPAPPPLPPAEPTADTADEFATQTTT